MVDLGFDGQVAIITGAGGGLGRQHALLLASGAALVVVNDVGGAVDGTGGDAGPASRWSTRSRPRAARPSPTPTRWPRPRAARPSCRPRVDTFGRIDIVVNNAGILRDKSFHNITPDLVDPVIDVHLRGAFYVTQPAWVHMREQAYGRIDRHRVVDAGIFGNFGQANYGAAKMGLVGLAHVLAQEGERYNIKANAIAPIAGTRMTARDLRRRARRQARPRSSCRRWSPGSPTRTARSRATPTRSAAGASPGSFIGEGPGTSSPDAPLTVEDVRDHFDEIERTDDFTLMRERHRRAARRRQAAQLADRRRSAP